jgi:3-hydroxyacyl-CoA dehydrogenase/enoyl-CoA hydratase/3-hydroxybutyryl-CoA epimerase
VFATYVMEGIAMLAEGVHPALDRVAGVKAGMPMPPLALQDEVSLSLSLHVSDQTRRDLEAEGKSYPTHPGEAVLRAVRRDGPRRQEGRARASTTTRARKEPVAGADHAVPAARRPAHAAGAGPADVHPGQRGRALLEENVVRSVADANIGSIFGWGFAPHQGGALQFINAMGVQRFVARSRELARQHGARFEPAAILVQMAQEPEVPGCVIPPSPACTWIINETHGMVRDTMRRFVNEAVKPHIDAWEEAGAFPREIYRSRLQPGPAEHRPSHRVWRLGQSRTCS